MSLEHPWVQEARRLAQQAHATQVRKDNTTPYFEHLEAVAHILLEHGYEDPATLAAAYLHDVFEDQPAHAEAVREAMAAEVIDRVEALTERKTDADGRTRPKPDRFHAYVARLSDGSVASLGAVPISCADKIHNTRSLVEAEAAGIGLLSRLSTRPEEHAPHLATLRDLYAPVVNPALLGTFEAARDALLELIARRRSLHIRLDEPSRAVVRNEAAWPVVRGDHVTLVHGVDPEGWQEAWMPSGMQIGADVEVVACQEYRSDRLQVWRVEFEGRSVRPWDHGVLHVTVSRHPEARSRDANRLLSEEGGAALRVPLRGTVTWVEP